MYCPDITDVPAINIQSSNIQYFSRTRKSNLTTLFCKDIVCAIYVMLVHVQNEINGIVVYINISSPILYTNTPTYHARRISNRRQLIKIYSPQFIFYFVCLETINVSQKNNRVGGGVVEWRTLFQQLQRLN